jgi:putative toxin-antitoxin system antitoxin component (TIGR02293 family)
MAKMPLEADFFENKQTGASTAIDAYGKAIRAGQAGSYSFVSLVGLRTHDPLGIWERVERGLAYGALERFQRNSGFSTKELAHFAAIKLRTLHRRKEEGRLHPEESDRLLRVSRIFGKALELFEGDPEAARRWLATPQAALGDQPPMALARTDVGAREVEALVDRLEHGVLT